MLNLALLFFGCKHKHIVFISSAFSATIPNVESKSALWTFQNSYYIAASHLCDEKVNHRNSHEEKSTLKTVWKAKARDTREACSV